MPLRNLQFIFSAGLPIPTDLAGRFGWIAVSWLVGLVGAQDQRNAQPDPLLARVAAVLRRRATRFAALVAQYRAGTLQPRPAAAPVPAGRGDVGGNLERRQLPRARGWLVRLVPDTWMQGEWLRDLLEQPQTVAFLAACPEARRMLRSTLHSLALDPLPEVLAPDVQPCPFVHSTPPVDVSRYIRGSDRATPGDPPSSSGVDAPMRADRPLKFWPA